MKLIPAPDLLQEEYLFSGLGLVLINYGFGSAVEYKRQNGKEGIMEVTTHMYTICSYPMKPQ